MENFEELQLGSILDSYPLSAPRVLYYFEASKRNDNFLVEDASGRRYVLRRYRRNSDPQRVAFQLRFQQELQRLGFPSAEIIPPKGRTAAEESFVVAKNGVWALSTYVEGQEYDFARPAQVRGAARYLAGFHNLRASLNHEEVISAITPIIKRWWTDSEAEIEGLEKLFIGDNIQDEISFLRTWRQELLEDCPLGKLEALPVGWVHGDYHGRNMVFVEDRLTGVFDLDVLHRGPMLEDLGFAIFMFGREKRGSHSIRADIACTFLAEYIHHRPLSQQELEALPTMVVISRMPSARYYEFLRLDGDDHLRAFRSDISAMRDLQQEMVQLGPILAKAFANKVR